MPEEVFWLAVIAMTVVAPLALILNFVTKWKMSKGLSSDEQRILEELWHECETLHDRIETLETILDDRAPDWRRHN